MSSGCGCKEVYRSSHITYPYSSCICSFCLLLFIFKMFFVLVPVHMCNLLNNFFAQYKQHMGDYGHYEFLIYAIYGRPTEAV